MSTNSTPIKKSNFLKVLEKKCSNVSEACKEIGIDRSTYYKWLDRDSKFKIKCEEIKEQMLDLAESMLLKKIKDGDITAIIFTLKTRGKNRGYSERQEIEHSGGLSINVASIARTVKEQIEIRQNRQDNFEDFESLNP